MKKFTLFAAAAAAVLGASAQGAVDPGIAHVLEGGKIATMQFINLDEFTVADLEAKGTKMQNLAPDEVNKFLYVWDATMNGVDDPGMPGVDGQTAGFSCFSVAGVGWSGAGYNITPEAKASTETWNDETRFHCAYCTPTANGPASIALIIADGETSVGSKPAKVAVGAAFDDGGKIYPSVAPAATDEWQAVDISFKELKKFYPAFDYKAVAAWDGNILSFLAGGVEGKVFALDAIYFYNYAGGSGIANVGTEATDIVITGRTVNAHGAAGITLYDLTGKAVKVAAGSVMGIDNVPAGLYIVKAGNAVRKVLVK